AAHTSGCRRARERIHLDLQRVRRTRGQRPLGRGRATAATGRRYLPRCPADHGRGIRGTASMSGHTATQGPVFNTEDWLVVALFVVAMIAIVLYAMRAKARSGKDYFLSGRDSNWLMIGTSIFSSNIGSEHLVGLAGAGFATGMAMSHWEIQSWLILVLGWVFVPLYDRMKVFTMPEFLELRFSRGSRNILSLLTIASLVLTKIAVTIYAGDVVVRTL